MKSVFLSLPIQGNRLPTEIYLKLVRILFELGFRLSNPAVLHPPLPEEVNLYSAQNIYTENLRLLAASDLLVAEISTPSLGVGYEIATAAHFKLPILCIYQRDYEQHVSLMIRGSSYSGLRIVTYQTLGELEAKIVEVLRRYSNFFNNKQQFFTDQVRYKIATDCHFDMLAPAYDTSTDWRHNEEMLSWFKGALSGSKHCLDLGTGTGLIGECLQKAGIFVVGVDRSLIMLHHARCRLNLVLCADAMALPFPNGKFDAVSVRQVFHYVDDQACLKEIARIIVRNGLLACANIAAPDNELSIWWQEIKKITQPVRRRFYTFMELIALVNEAGFEVERVEPMELVRRDPWERFLVNCNSEAKLAIRELLQEAPRSIRNRIKLELSDAGVSYLQHWLLILCRNCRPSGE